MLVSIVISSLIGIGDGTSRVEREGMTEVGTTVCLDIYSGSPTLPPIYLRTQVDPEDKLILADAKSVLGTSGLQKRKA